jgi:acetoin:2,6-dichlorophenolindophenol oxidoreductase subunit beta
MSIAETVNRKLSYSMAIHEAQVTCMSNDDNVVVIGEGVPDPKGIFGTTSGLLDKFGEDRVFDMPLSENGLTGICIGAAIMGLRPVMVHQRIDFALLAMDQLVNNAAKWHYMFNGQTSVPLVVRLIVGRGWGQGPQHSQSLHSMFAHIPGLKVVMPTTAKDAKGLLISAIEDDGPVLFIEHRWVHQLEDFVPPEYYKIPLNANRKIREGKTATVVAFSYMVIEAIRVADKLSNYDFNLEVIDMRSVNPLNMDMVIESVKKTGYLLVLDPGWKTGGIGAEIIAQVIDRAYNHLEAKPLRLAYPDHPVPTSRFLADSYYPDAADIAGKVFQLIGADEFPKKEIIINDLVYPSPRDVPDNEFTGPF